MLPSTLSLALVCVALSEHGSSLINAIAVPAYTALSIAGLIAYFATTLGNEPDEPPPSKAKKSRVLDSQPAEKIVTLIKEPITGIGIEQQLEMAGSTPDTTVDMCMLGIGLKIKKIGISIRVCVVCMYVGLETAKEFLSPFAESVESPEYFNALVAGDEEPFCPRLFHHSFCRSVRNLPVVTVICGLMEGKVEDEVYQEFKRILSTGIGKGIATGETLQFFFPTRNTLRVLVRGEIAGEMSDPRFIGMMVNGYILASSTSFLDDLLLSVKTRVPRVIQLAEAKENAKEKS